MTFKLLRKRDKTEQEFSIIDLLKQLPNADKINNEISFYGETYSLSNIVDESSNNPIDLNITQMVIEGRNQLPEIVE